MLTAQVLAILIFIAMFILIVTDKIERHIVTLGCGCLTLVVVFGILMRNAEAIWQTLNLKGFFEIHFWYRAGQAEETAMGINWATIIFIAGMMIMVEGMAKAGFFYWLCMKLAGLVRYRPSRLFVVFMILSAALAMFIDSITVILFLAAMTVELSRLLRFNPVPMILSEIFCANLGGSATMCGDPPNIIIGTSLGYTFADFILNTGLIMVISMAVIVLYFYFVFRRELAGYQEVFDVNTLPAPGKAIASKKAFVVHCGIFLGAVVLLITHAQTGFTVALIGVAVAAATLLAAGKDAWNLLKKVDYKTLLFFIGLFIVVGGLEHTGILKIIAGHIGAVSRGNLRIMVVIIIWISAIASAFVDNIPFAATMVPVIRSLAATQGMDLSILAWTLAMGTDIGGSATPIGASANVVGTAAAAREGYQIGWGKYCRTALPATAIVIFISMVIIFIRYC